MFAALLASAAAFVPLPQPVRYGAAPAVHAPAPPAPANAYPVPSYAAAAPVWVPRSAQVATPVVQRRDSALGYQALHAAVTGALAASIASLGLLSTARSPRAATRRTSPLIQMVETETKEPSILEKMRGVVVKTKAPAVEMTEMKEEQEDSKNMMQKVKDAGVAGIISYVFWEWAFWGVSVPVSLFGFQAATGHWPDFSNQEDITKLGAEAFAFVNVARFAIPLRIGLALGTTPWVQENIVDRFQKKDDA